MNKKFICILLIGLIMSTIIPFVDTVQAAGPSPYSYHTLHGRFEYWQDSNGEFWCTPWGSSPKSLGDDKDISGKNIFEL